MKTRFNSWASTIFYGIILLSVTSCKKDKLTDSPTPTVPPTKMEYFDLGNTIIKTGSPGYLIDLNHDGRKDLAFTTLLVGDPLNQVDKLQFLISTNIQVNLPVNASEQIPLMNTGDVIAVENFNEYHWLELSSILLVQKIISFTSPPIWEGQWKNAFHQYLPYQLTDNMKRYNGWVLLSVDVAGEKIILHKAAISKEADKIIKAGN
ncbi:hypothetical protein BH11BAC3_BH11BAC3_11890 [soil metagenome]